MTAPSAIPATEPLRLRLLPYLVLVALAAAAFLAAWRVPYRVDTDSGFQLRSLQQWVHGESTSPTTLRMPDPQDLSRDELVWSNWWPPGFPFLYAPLAAAGFSIATTLRVTSFLLFLVGGLGWLGLAERLRLPPAIRVLYALSLMTYVVTIGGAATLRTADILSFAAGPWLLRLVLARTESEGRPAGLFLTGVALGLTYWLKYTLFLTAVPLAAWLAFRLAWSRERSPALRAARIALLGLGCSLPVLGLFSFHLSRSSGRLKESVTGARSDWGDAGRGHGVEPPLLAASFVGAPGLALFQNDLWITHLSYFSDRWLPFLRGRGDEDRLLVKSLLALPGALALFWALRRERRRRGGPEVDLALVVMAGFYLEVLGISLFVRYNYLANEARLAAGFMPFLFPLALSGWLSGEGRPRRALGLLLLGLLFLPSLLFAGANFVKNEIRARLHPPYTPSGTGLYMPEISSSDVPAVQRAVAATLRSPGDLVVLAGPSGWGSPFGVWLESPWRTLPMGTFYASLGGGYLAASNVNATSPLHSSRPLRIVLVAARTLVAEGRLGAIEARFPQAHEWRPAPGPAHANVAIYWADVGGD
jgi:hypothetical protein